MRCAKWFLFLLVTILPIMAIGQAADVANDPGAADESTEGESDMDRLESESMLPQGGFDNDPETATEPKGWRKETLEGGAWALDRETKLAGAAALRVTPGAGAATVASLEIPVTDELKTAAASVAGRGEAGTKALLRWTGAGQVVREDALRMLPPMPNGWRRFVLNEVERPEGAESVALLLVAEPEHGDVWWDTAQITGNFARTAKLGVFCNQLGYSIKAPKRFTAYSSFMPMQSSFALIAAGGEAAFTGTLDRPMRITDADGHDWGYFYAQGDLSTFNIPGVYTIRITLDGKTADSGQIEIGDDILWQQLMPLMVQQYFFARSGVEVPNFHEAWHADDAVDPDTGAVAELAGGWYDDGFLSKEDNAGLLWRLAQAYQLAKWRFDEDITGKAVQEELAWGAEFMRRLIGDGSNVYAGVAANPEYNGAPGKDTDNTPASGDERKAIRAQDVSPMASALAAAARHQRDNTALIEAAKQAVESAVARGVHTPALFDAAMNLYLITMDPAIGQRAQELFPGPLPEYLENVLAHDDEFGTASTVQGSLAVTGPADELVRLSKNPFGVCARTWKSRPVFFLNDANALDGNTQYILEAAETVAKAYRFNPRPDYVAFIHDQFNWLLGNNPLGVCLVEGTGHVHVPRYASLLLNGSARRGATPGAIANGIAAAGPGDDRPFFDMREEGMPEMRTNGYSLRSNALAISTLAHLNRFRFKTLIPR